MARYEISNEVRPLDRLILMHSDRIIFPSEYGHLFYLLLIIYYVLTTLEQETLYL